MRAGKEARLLWRSLRGQEQTTRLPLVNASLLRAQAFHFPETQSFLKLDNCLIFKKHKKPHSATFLEEKIW